MNHLTIVPSDRAANLEVIKRYCETAPDIELEGLAQLVTMGWNPTDRGW